MSIIVNRTPLTPWNPFIPDNKARQELEPEEVNENGHKVVIRPYVLPHKTKFAMMMKLELPEDIKVGFTIKAFMFIEINA